MGKHWEVKFSFTESFNLRTRSLQGFLCLLQIWLGTNLKMVPKTTKTWPLKRDGCRDKKRVSSNDFWLPKAKQRNLCERKFFNPLYAPRELRVPRRFIFIYVRARTLSITKSRMRGGAMGIKEWKYSFNQSRESHKDKYEAVKSAQPIICARLQSTFVTGETQ